MPESANIRELIAPKPPAPRRGFWFQVFSGLDVALKLHERLPTKPLRKSGRNAEKFNSRIVIRVTSTTPRK